MARDQYVLTQRTAKHQHKKQLTQAEKYKVYCNLKKRVKKKSKDAYHDNGTEPEGLRLERIGSNIDKQVVYIVQYGTFNELLNKMGKETGFECLVYVTPSKLKRLYVNFANFKMYTESKNAYVGKKPQLSGGFFLKNNCIFVNNCKYFVFCVENNTSKRDVGNIPFFTLINIFWTSLTSELIVSLSLTGT